MRRTTLILLLLVGVAALLALAACAKATPTPTATPRPPTPTSVPGVTPVATKVPTVAPTATLLPTIPAVEFKKGPPAAGVYKTYEEAMKAWPNVVAAAKKEGTLVVTLYVAAPAPGSYTDLIFKAFTTKYGIPIDYVLGRTPEHLAKLAAEKITGRHTYNTWPTGPNGTRPVCDDPGNYCEPFVPPNALEPGVPWIVSPFTEGAHLEKPTGGTVYLWQRNAILINTKVEPDQTKWPKSHKDLEASYWKGKLTMQDPRIIGPSADYLDYVSRPEGEKLGLGKRHIQAIIKNFGRLYPSSTDATAAVMRGDHSIQIMTPVSAAFPQYTSLPQPWSWRFLEMEEGEPGWVLSATLFRNAPAPNAAKLFIDFLVSKEADGIRGNAWGTGVGRRDTKVIWDGVIPKKVFPVDYGDVQATLVSEPMMIAGEVSQWLKEAGF